MNNASKLRQLKDEHGLTSQDCADIMGVSLRSLHAWLLKPDSSSFREMPDERLEYLQYKLKYPNEF